VDRVTLAQVAEEAGVSAMTVSNVLNGRSGASDATRERITAVAERLGYVPNLAARGLKLGRTGLVGVVMLDLTMQYGLEIVRGIADELASAEIEMLISATYQDATRALERIDFLTRGVVDGLVLVAPVLGDETLGLLESRGRPFVVADPRRIEGNFPRVVVDNYAGMRQVVEHLIDLGHHEIAFIGGDQDFDSSRIRYSGFADGMKLAGQTVDDELVRWADFSYSSGFRAATSLLAVRRPTAIVAGADIIALGAIDAARAHGLRVPDDVSVTGFDDLPQAADSFPGLTTVRQPLHDIGSTAARALLGYLDGSVPPVQRMQLPTELVVRGSSAPPRST
jgi:LacI family transcriptional regulator